MEIMTPVRAILDQKGSVVWSIGPEDTVFDAIELMAEHDVGALPVVKNDNLLGMVTERDYTRKVVLFGRSSKHTAVADIMTQDVVVVAPRDSVQGCMRLMTEYHVRHLPVVESGRIVGLISIGDVVNCIIGEQDAALADMEHFVTGAYPA